MIRDEETIPGPLQLYVTPCVVEFPVRVTVADEHVMSPDLFAVTPWGFIVLLPTLTLAVAKQPFKLLVTLSEYKPDTYTTGCWSVETKPPGPVHSYFIPLVEDEPFKVALFAAQVMIFEAVALTLPGAIVSLLTITESFDLQPFIALVAVTL